jgi:hypothetical protein
VKAAYTKCVRAVWAADGGQRASAPPPTREFGYFRVARHPPEVLHGTGTSSVQKTRPSMQRSWELCVADIKALDQAVFDSKHVTDHLIR